MQTRLVGSVFGMLLLAGTLQEGRAQQVPAVASPSGPNNTYWPAYSPYLNLLKYPDSNRPRSYFVIRPMDDAQDKEALLQEVRNLKDLNAALEQKLKAALELNVVLEKKIKAIQEKEALARKEAEQQRDQTEVLRAKAVELQKLAEEQRQRADVARAEALQQLKAVEARRLEALKAVQDQTDALAQKLKEAQQREAEQRAQAEEARRLADLQAERARAEALRAAQEEARAREQADRSLRILREAEARNASNKGEAEATKKYQKAVAEHFLQAVLSRNGRGLGGTLSKDLQSSIGEGKVQAWMEELHPTVIQYRDIKFEPELTAPSGEDAVFTGFLSGTSSGTARFSVRVVKDKNSGRYVIDSASVVGLPK
jgi:hypothetical protein